MNPSFAITTQLATVFRKVNELRRRTWSLALLRGGCAIVWIWLGSLVLLGGLNLLYPIPTPVRFALFLLHLGLIGVGGLYAAGRGVLRNRNVRAWALRCEELYPFLNNQLVTCVDIACEPDGEMIFTSSPVASALLQDTTNRVKRFDPERVIPKERFRNYVLASILPLLVLWFCALVSPGLVERLAMGLYHYKIPVAPLFFKKAASPQAKVTGLSVRPGDVEIPRGSSVSVEAEVKIEGTKAPEQNPVISLLDEKGPAKNYAMVRDLTSTAPTTLIYKMALHDVMAPMKYQVAMASDKSPVYKIQPFDPPKIEKVVSKVTPPAYLKQGAKDETGMYISSLTHSSVRMKVSSDHELNSARLVDEKGNALAGKLDKKEASFTFDIKESVSYKLEVTDTGNHTNPDPPMIQINAEEDLPPTVKMNRPGADWYIHRIGEVEFVSEAEDDHGIQEIVLEYRVNDSTPTTRTLFTAPKEGKPVTKQKVNYTLALEDLKLKDGDSIFYQIRAGDGQPDAEKRWGPSQPFFVNIRPFEQIFMKGEASPPGSPGTTQKQVIVATQRLLREKSRLSGDKLAEQASSIARMQKEVRAFAERLREKIRMRPQIPNHAERLAHMESAVQDMKKAEASLEKKELGQAIGPENSALRHMDAALAGLPEAANWADNGGPTPFGMMNPPIDLMAQKLDFKKDNYEMMESPAERKKIDKKLQEAIERVRALAQRQKEFAETVRRERQDDEKGQGGTGSGGGSTNVKMEKMLKSSDESRFKLEKLRESLKEMKGVDPETIKAMQQSLDKTADDLGKVDEALRNKELQKAEGANARALEKLQQMEQSLEKTRQQMQKASMDALAQRLSGWVRRQESVWSSTKGLAQNSPSEQAAKREQLSREQGKLAAEANQAAQQLRQAENQGTPQQQASLAKTMEQLKQAADWMAQASKSLSESNDGMALQSQKAILEQLDRIQSALDKQMAGNTGKDPQADLSRTLSMVRALKSTLQAKTGSSKSGREMAQSGKQGQQGKEGQGQQGKEGQGQQGKEGQGQQGKEGQGQQGKEGQGQQGKEGQGQQGKEGQGQQGKEGQGQQGKEGQGQQGKEGQGQQGKEGQGQQGKEGQGQQGKEGQGQQGKEGQGQQGKEGQGQQGQQGQGQQGQATQGNQPGGPGAPGQQQVAQVGGQQGQQSGQVDRSNQTGKMNLKDPSQSSGNQTGGYNPNIGPNQATTQGTVVAPEEVRIYLEELRQLKKKDPTFGPLVERVERAAALGGDAFVFTDPKSIEIAGDMNDALDGIEELLTQKLNMMDQMQRLQQAPEGQIPEEYKDMAAKYFEKLSAISSPKK